MGAKAQEQAAGAAAGESPAVETAAAAVPAEVLPADYPAVQFDARKGANYHLADDGARIYHGVPEGFRFQADGTLVPVEAGN